MRLSRTSTLTALLAVTVTAASTGTAQAVDPNSQAEAIADQISDIAPGVEIATALDLGESLLAAVENGYVSVPNSPAASVNITPLAEGVPDLAVSLPQLEGAASARLSDDGTVVYTSEDAASLAVQPLADGGTRFLSVLEDHSAPSAYDYVFEGAQLELLDDGSVSVTQDGAETARIDAPWALDAEGAAVPTHSEVNGDTLTQVVDHAVAGFSYPITADPKISHGWGIYFHFNRTETKLFASYGVDGMAGGTGACALAGGALGTVVAPIVGSAVGAAIGGAACGAVVVPFVHNAGLAQLSKPKKCVYLRFTYGVWTSGTYADSRCK